MKKIGENKRKYNKYDLSGEYGIGWTTNTNKEFYFDLEDYDKIKDYCWVENGNKYLTAYNKKDKSILFHRLIMNCPNNMTVDHINHNTFDNRKLNLRNCTYTENSCNKKIPKNNKSGHKNVFWNNTLNKWEVSIVSYGKQKTKYFNNYKEACIYSDELRKEIHREFANQ